MDPQALTINQDDELQEHFVRMQKTLISAVDKELLEMEFKLKDTVLDLKKVEDDKTAIGVALYQANTKIGRMNGQLEA